MDRTLGKELGEDNRKFQQGAPRQGAHQAQKNCRGMDGRESLRNPWSHGRRDTQ